MCPSYSPTDESNQISTNGIANPRYHTTLKGGVKPAQFTISQHHDHHGQYEFALSNYIHVHVCEVNIRDINCKMSRGDTASNYQFLPA